MQEDIIKTKTFLCIFSLITKKLESEIGLSKIVSLYYLNLVNRNMTTDGKATTGTLNCSENLID